jgi:hypothetical protein
MNSQAAINPARLTPPAVREWLSGKAQTPRRVISLPNRSLSRDQPAKASIEVGDAIAKALLTDERMEEVWRLIGRWPGALDLVQVAVRYSNPLLLENLMAAPKDRTAFGNAALFLSETAQDFAFLLDSFSPIATELWGGPVGPLVERLRAFAQAAAGKANEARVFYNFVPKPNPRGRGSSRQRVFRDAMTSALTKLIEHHGGKISREDQDVIIATLASAIFPGSELQPESVRRHRERQKRKQRTDRSV